MRIDVAKQYCRYCIHLVTGNGIWCEKRKREYSESYAKSTNNCGDFELNVIDAFFENDKGYQPREEQHSKYEQITFDEVYGDE